MRPATIAMIANVIVEGSGTTVGPAVGYIPLPFGPPVVIGFPFLSDHWPVDVSGGGPTPFAVVMLNVHVAVALFATPPA